MSSGEIRRLQQDILQRRASEINRFEPQNIDRARLLQSQFLAGKVPVSKKLLKEQKKKKRKGRKAKNLRSDVARMMKEQRAAEKGETRDIRLTGEDGELQVVGQTEERRIIGDPVDGRVGANAGSGLIPEIDDRKIQQQILDREQRLEIEDRREVLAIADRRQRGRIEDRRATDDATFRRLELQDRQRPALEFTRVADEQRQALAQQQADYQDQNQRQFAAASDAILQQLEDRFGQGDAYLAENRQRVEALEERERRRQEPVVRPADYDSLILDASDVRDDFSTGAGLTEAVETPIRAVDQSDDYDEWASRYTAKQEASSNSVNVGYMESIKAKMRGGSSPPPLTPEDRPGSGLRDDLENPSFYARPSPSQARPSTPVEVDAPVGLTESAFDRAATTAQEEVSALSTGLDLPSPSPETRGSPAALGPSAPSRLTSTEEAFPGFDSPEPERLQQEDSVQPRILRGDPEPIDRFGDFAPEADVSRSLQGQRRVPVGVEAEGVGQVEEEEESP